MVHGQTVHNGSGSRAFEARTWKPSLINYMIELHQIREPSSHLPMGRQMANYGQPQGKVVWTESSRIWQPDVAGASEQSRPCERGHAKETMQTGSSPLDQKVNAPASEYGYVRPDHHASATSGISNLGGPRIERITTLEHNTFADTFGAFFQARILRPHQCAL